MFQQRIIYNEITKQELAEVIVLNIEFQELATTFLNFPFSLILLSNGTHFL